jgi:hypothetical protein
MTSLRRAHGRHTAATTTTRPRRTLRQRLAPGVALAAGLLLGGTMTAIAAGNDGARSGDPEPAGYSLYTADETPAVLEVPDEDRITVGVEFSAAAAGEVSAVRFYRAPGNRGPHRVHLWDDQGQELATKPIFDAGTGWVTVDFDAPVPIEAEQEYTAGYTAPRGHYSVGDDVLDGARSSDALTASRGVYTYRDDRRPRRSAGDTSFYVDVVYTPTGHHSTPPTDSETSTPTTSSRPSPTRSTSTPTDEPTEPSEEPTEPTEEPTQPTEEPTQPTEEPTDPGREPTPTGAFPDAGNTGVPAGTALAPYTGPCTITTAGTVIDGARVDCSLSIQAAGVVIRNSLINGTVENADEASFGFTIQDSEVDVGDRDGTGIANSNFTVLRVEVRGGNRSINCWRNCTVRDSWVHGQFRDETGVFHESGIRMGSGGTIVHNSIGCDAPVVPPDAGCSAPLTGYGDFGVVQDNLIQGNLFLASTGAACAYGGSSAGKPYSSGTNDVRFIDNVFQRGPSGECAAYGPIIDYDRNAPGNEFTGNEYDDGTPIPEPSSL